MESTTKPALIGTLQQSSQPTNLYSECHECLFFLNLILFMDTKLFYCKYVVEMVDIGLAISHCKLPSHPAMQLHFLFNWH